MLKVAILQIQIRLSYSLDIASLRLLTSEIIYDNVVLEVAAVEKNVSGVDKVEVRCNDKASIVFDGAVLEGDVCIARDHFNGFSAMLIELKAAKVTIQHQIWELRRWLKINKLAYWIFEANCVLDKLTELHLHDWARPDSEDTISQSDILHELRACNDSCGMLSDFKDSHVESKVVQEHRPIDSQLAAWRVYSADSAST